MLKELAGCSGLVVATGGGVVGRSANWDAIAQTRSRRVSGGFLGDPGKTAGRLPGSPPGQPRCGARPSSGIVAEPPSAVCPGRFYRRHRWRGCAGRCPPDPASVGSRRQILLEKLVVGLAERSYPIWIGAGIFDRLPQALAEVPSPGTWQLFPTRRCWPCTVKG